MSEHVDRKFLEADAEYCARRGMDKDICVMGWPDEAQHVWIAEYDRVRAEMVKHQRAKLAA